MIIKKPKVQIQIGSSWNPWSGSCGTLVEALQRSKQAGNHTESLRVRDELSTQEYKRRKCASVPGTVLSVWHLLVNSNNPTRQVLFADVKAS